MISTKQASSEPTDVDCDRCGEKMNIKWSSRGEFLGCGGYPKCRNTREFTRGEDGTIAVKMPKLSGDKCPTCSKDMIIKNGRFGEYIACVDYPSCPTVKSPKSDVKCPEEGCSGGLVPRRTRTGKTFWGCTNYPGCQYAVWDKPIKAECGACNFPMLTEKTTKKDGTRHICPKCKAVHEAPEAKAEEGK